MATGLPVLATDVGGNSDLVASGLTGILVPAGDLQGMVQGLVQLASNRQGAACMGQAGRARMEARFSLRRMVGAYQTIYDQQCHRACGALARV
jgi:glycosyltransferase involved in cell wall biosynthesis